MTLTMCFALPPSTRALKRSRPRPLKSPHPPACNLRPAKSAALSLSAAVAATLLLAAPSSPKTVLSSNTILRRYVATDSDAILRYALPLPSERTGETNPPTIRRAQELLERLGVDVRARGAAGLIAGRRDLTKLRTLIVNERLDILLGVPAKKRTAAAEYLSSMEKKIAGIEGELGLPSGSPGFGAASVFPKQIIAVTDTIQDVIESRNSMSKRTNFDGERFLSTCTVSKTSLSPGYWLN